jgi:hypothetical protein
MQIQELSIDPNPYNNELNPVLWNNNELKPEVRHRLLKMAKHFVEYLEVTNLKLRDVTLSGSSAGYNYSEFSDIDLHLVVNSEETFSSQKNQYNATYDLKIKDIPVELYVQPASQTHHSAGIYSVLDNKWLSEPTHSQPTINPKDIKSKARNYAGKINSAIRSGELEQAKDVWAELRRLRKAGLEVGGEQSVENLAFKLLRARGQIDILRKYIDKLESSELSLKEQ